ncbi:MAG: HDOD domain-containing protein [Calditrichaeota bacterium]|nr:MAG: HDOD domain-containing protein [Calditrichota bacterium]
MHLQLTDVVRQIDRLPSPNHVALEVMRLCSEPEITISRLVKLISTDQSLTAQILKIANSSYFNFPKRISTLERAVVVLGLNLIRDIAISLAFYSFYKGFRANKYVDFNYLWHHSVLSAVVASGLANKFDTENKHQYYTAGLLHDIGKLVEAEVIGKDFYFLMEKSQDENVPLYELEQKLLGFHHAEVGSTLLGRWNLPDYLVTMIKFHHTPNAFIGEPEMIKKIRFLYLSNVVTHFLQEEFTDYSELLEKEPQFSHYFSFNYNEFEDLIHEISQYVEDHRQLFEMYQVG